MVGALAERKVPGKAIAMAKNKVFIYYLEEYFQKIGGEWLHCPNIRSALFADSHFPTQKFLNIVPSTSSVVTSPPVISAK